MKLVSKAILIPPFTGHIKGGLCTVHSVELLLLHHEADHL
jgi:hypothetical protein